MRNEASVNRWNVKKNLIESCANRSKIRERKSKVKEGNSSRLRFT